MVKKTIFVTGLGDEVTVDILHSVLIPFGEVKDISIPMNHRERTNKGYAFVEFEEEDDADAAIANLDGSELMGRVLKVNTSKFSTRHKEGDKPLWQQEQWLEEQQKEDDMEIPDAPDSLLPSS